jgi:nickel-dependent lactate racemase
MMEIIIPYGRSTLTAQIPDRFDLEIIDIPDTPPAPDPFEVVKNSLENLLGEVSWSDYLGVKSVAIAVNDKTRPVPHQHLLPPLLKILASLGIPDEAITFYIAVGSHHPMRPEEFPAILPDQIVQRYKIVSHDSENKDRLIFLGETKQGTPVWTNRAYVQADLKIVVGNIEPHQFVGFSGGVKSAAIGLAGLITINSNHKLMTHSDSQMGLYAENPVRQDVEEIGLLIGVDLALNSILNQDKEIVHVLAGHPVTVIETGVPLSRQISQVAVPQTYRLVIASPGGHPKDIDVYQSQKGLVSAARVTRAGGTLILTAACTEGSGSSHFEESLQDKKSYQEVKEQFWSQEFRIGPHKAYLFARDAADINLKFCSELDHNLANKLLLNPCKNLQNAIDTSLGNLSSDDKIAVLPHASATIPFVTK